MRLDQPTATPVQDTTPQHSQSGQGAGDGRSAFDHCVYCLSIMLDVSHRLLHRNLVAKAQLKSSTVTITLEERHLLF